MVYENGCYFGWILSESAWGIAWLAEQFPEMLRGYRFALITCHDSNRNSWLQSMYYEYRAERPDDLTPFQFTENGVMIAGAVVCDMLLKDDFFGGFDEVWFSQEEIIEPLFAELSLTSEAEIISTNGIKRRKAMSEWMTASKCSLGVGDGYGINYSTTSYEIAVMLEKRAALPH